MFFFVTMAGWIWFLMAKFSVGRPKADGVQDVVALHPLFAADDIHRRERARMADVQTRGRGIRELDEAVELRLVAAGNGGIGLGLLPFFLPFLLDGCKIVFHNKLLCLVIFHDKNAPDRTGQGRKIRGTTLLQLQSAALKRPLTRPSVCPYCVSGQRLRGESRPFDPPGSHQPPGL